MLRGPRRHHVRVLPRSQMRNRGVRRRFRYGTHALASVMALTAAAVSTRPPAPAPATASAVHRVLAGGASPGSRAFVLSTNQFVQI